MNAASSVGSWLRDLGVILGLVAALGAVYEVDRYRPRHSLAARADGPPGSASVPKAEPSILTAGDDARKAASKPVSAPTPPPKPEAPAPKPEELTRAPAPAPKPEPADRGAAQKAPEFHMIAGSPFQRRVEERREEWIAEYGGSPESERAVTAGLEWLARHQAKDGSWSARCVGDHMGTSCEPPKACDGPGQYHAMAQTGLALLAFQAGGHFAFNNRPYSQHVQRGLDWLIDHQREDGGLFPNGPNQAFMYEHGIATFALAEACAVSQAMHGKPDSRLRAAAEAAVRYIEKGQHDDGGWRYTTSTNEPSDVSVSGWQALALKSAVDAEIPVSKDTIGRAQRFFRTCEVRNGNGHTSYQPGSGGGSMAMTGVGMLVHQFLLKDPESPLVQAAASSLAQGATQRWVRKNRKSRALIRNDVDYYLWYNCTLAMFQVGGKPWDTWNEIVRDLLLKHQVQGTDCERGSWPPDDQWGSSGGRVYSTALAVLSLEVYYRFSRKDDPAKPPGAPAEPAPAEGAPVEGPVDAEEPAKPAVEKGEP